MRRSRALHSLGLIVLLLCGRGVALAQPLEPSSHFASLDGVRLHDTNYGSGEVARLFVHGWSCDETVWKAQTPELTQTVRVLTVDFPGHGQSDKPELAYTMDFSARSLDAVLRDAGVKSATLVGHSNGSRWSGSTIVVIPRKCAALSS